MPDHTKPEPDDDKTASSASSAWFGVTRIHIGHVVGVTAFLAPIIGVVAPPGLAPLLAASALAAFGLKRLRDGRWPLPPVGLTILIATFFGWAVLSVVWSINSAESLGKLPRFAFLLMAGLVLADASLGLSDAHRRLVARHLTIGLTVALACMLLDRLTEGYFRELVLGRALDDIRFFNLYNGPATLFALFFWPLAAHAARIHVLAPVALWLVALGVVVSLFSSAAVVAIVLGGIGFVVLVIAPKIGAAVIAALLAIFVLVAPALPPSQTQATRLLETYAELPRSAYHRMLIWRFVADRISERPILGWGFNSSRVIPGRHDRLDVSEPALPLHPHNAALQWWLELGAPGAILGTALILWLMRAIGRARASIVGKASAVGLVLSAVTICFLSYGIWQSWWLAALWLAGAFMAALMRSPPVADSEPT